MLVAWGHMNHTTEPSPVEVGEGSAVPGGGQEGRVLELATEHPPCLHVLSGRKLTNLALKGSWDLMGASASLV